VHSLHGVQNSHNSPERTSRWF